MGARANAEQERQSREKRTFLSLAGLGFAGSLLVAVAVGHRRAHVKAQKAGEIITNSHTGWAMRAFGLGTLYAFAVVGCGTAAGSYYLQQHGITSVNGFAQYMRGQVRERMGGTLRDKLRVSDGNDQSMLDKADRWLTKVDEETGKRKIDFKRIRSQISDNDPETEPQKKLSLGARMRRAVGFGTKHKDRSDEESSDSSK
ncbi:hypothetical protein H4R20_002917 [Coemansia guatemalensis]|uniref:Uncharacterized protein n=1 Tax=Coemansia guatemalensis TaxID=2761395 RepID=A0A9W8HX05_9FUNG|nr:hypothetical protein H4R20_002917 [Coemansia guatemalensis]